MLSPVWGGHAAIGSEFCFLAYPMEFCITLLYLSTWLNCTKWYNSIIHSIFSFSFFPHQRTMSFAVGSDDNGNVYSFFFVFFIKCVQEGRLKALSICRRRWQSCNSPLFSVEFQFSFIRKVCVCTMGFCVYGKVALHLGNTVIKSCFTFSNLTWILGGLK